jgi:hypothetical protein
MPALTFGLAGDRCGGRTFSLSAAAANRGGSRGPCSNDETVEVGGDPAVWEDHCRFGQGPSPSFSRVKNFPTVSY